MRETCVWQFIETQNYLTTIWLDDVFLIKYLYFK
jgi:hypothetical protein